MKVKLSKWGHPYCYRCKKELTGISMLVIIKESGKRPHNEYCCLKCADIFHGKRYKNGMRIA